MPQHEIPEDEIPIEIRFHEPHPFAMVPKWVTAMVGAGALSFGAHFLFVVLLGYADRSRGSVFPNKKTLMADMGRTKRAVDGYMAELERVGVVYVQRRPQDDGRHKSNLYHLAVSGPIPPADRSRRPVDNSAGPGGRGPVDKSATPGAGGRVQKIAPWADTGPEPGEGAENCTHQGAENCTRIRITKDQEQKMPLGEADRPRSQAEPEDNPPPAKAGRDAMAEDFAAFWTAYRAASDRAPGSKRRAAQAYTLARRAATAAELLDRLGDYAAGRDRERRAAPSGFVAAFPDAERWLRDERWHDYAPAAPDGPSGAPGASGPSPGHLARVEALRGPYTPPDLPADLSPEDYRAAVTADRSEWLAGTGRWEAVTV